MGTLSLFYEASNLGFIFHTSHDDHYLYIYKYFTFIFSIYSIRKLTGYDFCPLEARSRRPQPSKNFFLD